jgi:hypothetical protein
MTRVILRNIYKRKSAIKRFLHKNKRFGIYPNLFPILIIKILIYLISPDDALLNLLTYLGLTIFYNRFVPLSTFMYKF